MPSDSVVFTLDPNGTAVTNSMTCWTAVVRRDIGPGPACCRRPPSEQFEYNGRSLLVRATNDTEEISFLTIPWPRNRASRIAWPPRDLDAKELSDRDLPQRAARSATPTTR